jgi:hypothetical protein
MVLLHYREEDLAEHVEVARAATQEPCGSEDSMDQSEGPEDHQREAMPDVREGAHEIIMVEHEQVPEAALPVAVAYVVAPQGEEAAPLIDMDGSTTPQREREAAEGLLLLKTHCENMLKVKSGQSCRSICCFREQAAAPNTSVAPPFR